MLPNNHSDIFGLQLFLSSSPSTIHRQAHPVRPSSGKISVRYDISLHQSANIFLLKVTLFHARAAVLRQAKEGGLRQARRIVRFAFLLCFSDFYLPCYVSLAYTKRQEAILPPCHVKRHLDPFKVQFLTSRECLLVLTQHMRFPRTLLYCSWISGGDH